MDQYQAHTDRDMSIQTIMKVNLGAIKLLVSSHICFKSLNSSIVTKTCCSIFGKALI